MHFSFFRVVAVVAVLTRSMSVTASPCASLGQACGTTSPTGLICCDDLFFALCTNRSPEVLPHTARNLESPDEFSKLSMSQYSLRS
ncbi:hypothetical protein C8R48DRAFT_735250 [Suillus tomentosus]|nr:hypothetical protein C8R48DRAFT_735250 [Suillus tomentosus]